MLRIYFGGIDHFSMDALYNSVTGFRHLFAVGILILLLLWESGSPYFGFFRARTGQRALHGARNIAIGILNAVVVAVGFVALWAAVTEWAGHNGLGLLNLIPLPSWVHIIGGVLLLDLWTYWWHRFNHIISLLWRFHKVHHSDPQMDVTTANRFHTGEIVFSSLLRVPVLALTGASLGELALFESLLFTNTQFHHANIGLGERVDRFLRIWITSPAMHKVHHSRWQPETDSNYTALLSVWDRLFGSFRLRADPHEISFGLDDTDRPEQQSLTGLLKMPATKPNRPPTD